MALFGRRDKEVAPPPKETVFPLTAKKAYCSICKNAMLFTKVWRRGAMMVKCPCCGLVFPNAAQLYQQVVPACPKCLEPLEQPGFDYGFCDGCGSKYELIEGTKPGLIPNHQQRQEMDKHGKSRGVL